MKKMPLKRQRPHSDREIIRQLQLVRPGTTLDLEFGRFEIELHQGSVRAESVLTLSCGVVNDASWIPTVRLHSACLFGEAFLSQVCDCRQQLNATLREVGRQGGVVVYAFQEGRGIGLCEKLLAMELERVRKVSTTEAFRALSHVSDPRNYDTAIRALRQKIVGKKVRVVTNNPRDRKSVV